MNRHIAAIAVLVFAGSALAAPASPRTADSGSDRAMTEVVVNAGARTPQLITATSHDYPALARRLGLEGAVQVRFRVGIDGIPRDVSIARSSGHRALDAAALREAAQWRFRPAQADGTTVETWASMPVSYALENPRERVAATPATLVAGN